MSSSFTIHSPTIHLDRASPEHSLKSGFGHRSYFDKPLINSAAKSIYDAGRNAKKIVEICCGYGDLLAALGRVFPTAEIIGIDQFHGTVAVASKRIAEIPNAKVIVGDVTKMDQFPDESIDFVIGQASMHHLTHNLSAAFTEFRRILKPGGKCMFTFEPLSHNHTVNFVRSIRNTQSLLIDESNLYIDTIAAQERFFSQIEVQCYNRTASYLMKALPPNGLFLYLSNLLRKYDSMRFSKSQSALRKATNFNVIFTR